MCNGHLLYNSFSVVWLQAFAGRQSSGPEGHHDSLDRQIFDEAFLQQAGSVSRCKLPGFSIDLRLRQAEEPVTIAGRVHVELASYFGATTNISYRLVIAPDDNRSPNTTTASPFCRASHQLTTDDVILVAGCPLGIEHWQASREKDRESKIELQVGSVIIKDLLFSPGGDRLGEPTTLQGGNEVILEVFHRYRQHFTHGRVPRRGNDSLYVMVDVWEDIQHSAAGAYSFSGKDAPSIIAHIEEHHRAELMGLLTLYPYEWPYRDRRYFRRICGSNIAIDTDDLVLASDNVCVVFGTYGIRSGDAPTDWRSVLADRIRDHVSWPEYLRILDIAVAKRHTIKATLSDLLLTSGITEQVTSRNLIKAQTRIAIDTTRLILSLHCPMFSRFQAHRAMYRATEERLEVAREMMLLQGSLAQFDTFLKTIDSIEEAERAERIKGILSYIAVASIFQVVFLQTEIPILEDLLGSGYAKVVGEIVLASVVVGLIVLMVATVSRVVASRKRRS